MYTWRRSHYVYMAYKSLCLDGVEVIMYTWRRSRYVYMAYKSLCLDGVEVIV